MLWGYKVKVIDRGLLSSADVGGIRSSSKVDKGHSSGLCGETRPGSKSNQFDMGETEGARTAKFKTRGFFSRRLIQNLDIERQCEEK